MKLEGEKSYARVTIVPWSVENKDFKVSLSRSSSEMLMIRLGT